MRYVRIALWMLLCATLPAQAQISVDIGFPGVNIGINVPAYPRLVRVPRYPVYYDPRANSNYFFYDGLYWVYQADSWYASSWYNGPWRLIERYDVPLYLLRVPVRYYRHPPAYFRGWRADAPPRWGDHWGGDWERRRAGWDQWDHRSAPAAAPLPAYQRQYSGNRYPRAPEQQAAIQTQNYRYQPRETIVQQQFQQQAAQQVQQQAPQQVQQQAAPSRSRAEPRPQAPVQQQSSTPQQRAQPTPPRQQPQSMQPSREQPVRQAQPGSVQQETRGKPAQQQSGHPVQVQPSQSPAQVQRAAPTPPETRGQERKAAPQGKGQENKPAPQGKGQENKRAPQGKGQENKPAPQGKGQENKRAPQDKGQENKKEEREQGRQ